MIYEEKNYPTTSIYEKKAYVRVFLTFSISMELYKIV